MRVDIEHRIKIDGKVVRILACGHQQPEHVTPAARAAIAANCKECPPERRDGTLKRFVAKKLARKPWPEGYTL